MWARRYHLIKFPAGLLLFGLVIFNVWHASKHGLWQPANFIDPLHLNVETAKLYKPFDNRLRPSVHGHYDGQWFYMISYDPFLIQRPQWPGWDSARYRYNRIIYPLAVHIFSVGQPKRYPEWLFALPIMFYLIGACATFSLAKLHHWTTLTLLGYLANTGLLFSIFRDLCESIGITFVIIGLVSRSKNYRGLMTVAFIAGVLTKEIFVVAPLSLYFWEWLSGARSFKQAFSDAIKTVIPVILWMSYVAYRIPNDNAFNSVAIACKSFGVGRFSLPFVAMTQETLYGMAHLTTRTALKLTASMSGVAFLITVCACSRCVVRPTLWNFLVATQALFICSTRGEIWNYYASSCRQTSLLLVLTVFWLADELRLSKVL